MTDVLGVVPTRSHRDIVDLPRRSNARGNQKADPEEHLPHKK